MTGFFLNYGDKNNNFIQKKKQNGKGFSEYYFFESIIH